MNFLKPKPFETRSNLVDQVTMKSKNKDPTVISNFEIFLPLKKITHPIVQVAVLIHHLRKVTKVIISLLE